MKNNNKKIMQKYKKKQIVIIFIIIIYFASAVVVFGRYVQNNTNHFFTKSKEFYFYSDKLGDNNPMYQIDNWSGVDDYTITVNMNSNANNLLASNYDISYGISYYCSDNVVCQLSKTQGTILGSTNKDFFNLTITPNRQLSTGDRVWVQITANATSPFEKTIDARFTLVVGQENLTYEIVDSNNSPYMNLKITNTLSYYTVDQAFNTYSVGDKIPEDTYLGLSDENKDKCYSAIVTLTFNPGDVVLDMTSNAYLNATNVVNTTYNTYNYINSITFKVDAVSSANVRFYKNNQANNYTYPINNNTSIVTLSSR